MIPDDYRLEHVAVSLIERLEGARRSMPVDEAAMQAALGELASRHVAAAAAEYREVAITQDPSAHCAFLEAEVRGTFLPRYTRLAHAMNRAETRGFGLGALATTGGRVGTGAAALLVLLVLLRFAYLPYTWPVIALVVLGVLLPDLLRILERRRYQAQLQEIVADLARIQTQQLAYAPDQLRVDDLPSNRIAREPVVDPQQVNRPRAADEEGA